MKRLFEVTVTKTILVLADDEREAELEAGTYESEEDGSIDVLGEVTSIDRVPEEWKDALPFGDQEGDLTVRQKTVAQLDELEKIAKLPLCKECRKLIGEVQQ